MFEFIKKNDVHFIGFSIFILMLVGLFFAVKETKKQDLEDIRVSNQIKLSNEQIVQQYDYCYKNKLRAKTLYTYYRTVGLIPTGVECGNFETQKYGDIKKSNITEITIEK